MMPPTDWSPTWPRPTTVQQQKLLQEQQLKQPTTKTKKKKIKRERRIQIRTFCITAKMPTLCVLFDFIISRVTENAIFPPEHVPLKQSYKVESSFFATIPHTSVVPTRLCSLQTVVFLSFSHVNLQLGPPSSSPHFVS